MLRPILPSRAAAMSFSFTDGHSSNVPMAINLFVLFFPPNSQSPRVWRRRGKTAITVGVQHFDFHGERPKLVGFNLLHCTSEANNHESFLFSFFSGITEIACEFLFAFFCATFFSDLNFDWTRSIYLYGILNIHQFVFHSTAINFIIHSWA